MVKKYGGAGTIFDRKDAYYENLGHRGTLRDEEIAWLASQGYTSGTLGDRWNAYLSSFGYTGTLVDKLRQWVDAIVAAVLGRFFHANYFHANYFHSNYWAKT